MPLASPNSSAGSIEKLPIFASLEDPRVESSMSTQKEDIANTLRWLGEDTGMDKTQVEDVSARINLGNETVASPKEFSAASAHTLLEFMPSDHSGGFSPIGGPNSDYDTEPEPELELEPESEPEREEAN
ncbi:hypothetical protein RUND412_008338 [Rhizina undulata]